MKSDTTELFGLDAMRLPTVRAVAGLLLLCVCSIAGLAAAQDPRNGVVKITSRTPEGETRTGAGFIVKLERSTVSILTAAQLVEGDKHPKVEFFTRQNFQFEAEVMQKEPEPSDVALLVVTGSADLLEGLITLELGIDNRALAEDVSIIGFPSDRPRSWAVTYPLIARLVLSGPVDESNCGSPLIKDGAVIGMVTHAHRYMGGALPALLLQQVMEKWGVALSTVSPGATGDGYAELASLKGVVRVYRGGSVLPALPRTQLQRGDEIWTGKDGTAVIRFPDRGEIFVAEDTRVRLGSLEVWFGSIFASVRGLFRVSSENVDAAVEGTRFQFEVGRDGSVRVVVVQGSVVVSSKSKEWRVRLPAGKQLISPYPNRKEPVPELVNAPELKAIEQLGKTVPELPPGPPGPKDQPPSGATDKQVSAEETVGAGRRLDEPKKPSGPVITPPPRPPPPVLPKVGDKWSYSIRYNRKEMDTLTVNVIRVSGDSVTEQLTTRTFKSNAERTFEARFDPTAFQQVKVSKDNFLSEFSPYSSPDSSQIGQKWNVRPKLTYKLFFDSLINDQPIEMTMEVVGRENIEVQAGKFSAIKVRAKSTATKQPGGAKEIQLEFWYVPDVKRTVKMSRTILNWATARDNQTDEYELVSYELK